LTLRLVMATVAAAALLMACGQKRTWIGLAVCSCSTTDGGVASQQRNEVNVCSADDQVCPVPTQDQCAVWLADGGCASAFRSSCTFDGTWDYCN
jgi:hypothetical protein